MVGKSSRDISHWPNAPFKAVGANAAPAWQRATCLIDESLRTLPAYLASYLLAPKRLPRVGRIALRACYTRLYGAWNWLSQMSFGFKESSIRAVNVRSQIG
jgi:hypothetical protein